MTNRAHSPENRDKERRQSLLLRLTEGAVCSCHINPPCEFCILMGDDEREVYEKDGSRALVDFLRKKDMSPHRLAVKEAFEVVGETCPFVDGALQDASIAIKKQTEALRQAQISAIERRVLLEREAKDLRAQNDQLEHATRCLLMDINKVCGTNYRTMLEASLHIANVVNNLRADLSTSEHFRKKAEEELGAARAALRDREGNNGQS